MKNVFLLCPHYTADIASLAAFVFETSAVHDLAEVDQISALSTCRYFLTVDPLPASFVFEVFDAVTAAETVLATEIESGIDMLFRLYSGDLGLEVM
jgi:hypothetical protein